MSLPDSYYTAMKFRITPMRDAPAVKLLLILLLLAMALVLVPFGCIMFDEDLVWESVSPEELSTLKEKGWIPESFPNTISNLSEAHALDTSYSFMRFDFDGEIDQITSGACIRTDNPHEAKEELYGFRSTKDWWQIAELKSRISNGDWPLYNCKYVGRYESKFWLTHSPNQRYYLWRNP
jgi:hypothetical protein